MKQIYIVLSRTGSLFSKIIEAYTKDTFNHVSISLHKNLEEMYSFGRKSLNYLDNGFVREHFTKGLYQYFPNADCCVLEMDVSEEQYDVVKRRIEQFCAQEDAYRYNLLGLVGHMLDYPMRRENNYFCSEFVATVLQSASLWGKPPMLTKPSDFLRLSGVRIIYQGKIEGACSAEDMRGWEGNTSISGHVVL